MEEVRQRKVEREGWKRRKNGKNIKTQEIRKGRQEQEIV